MTGRENTEPGVWQQLRNRRVTRTVVTYLAMGFAAMEATWFLVARYGLTDAVSRVVMGCIVLGFPLAIVLAWTYDLTPKGIVRTPEDAVADATVAQSQGPHKSPWLLVCLAAVVAGLVLRAVGS